MKNNINYENEVGEPISSYELLVIHQSNINNLKLNIKSLNKRMLLLNISLLLLNIAFIIHVVACYV